MPQAVGRSRPWRDHRQVVEGIVFRYRTGVAWRDLPGRFGPWQTVWKRHHRFATDGTWDKLLRVIQAEADAAGRVDWNVSSTPRSCGRTSIRLRTQRHRTRLQRLQTLAPAGHQIRQARHRLPRRPRPRSRAALAHRLRRPVLVEALVQQLVDRERAVTRSCSAHHRSSVSILGGPPRHSALSSRGSFRMGTSSMLWKMRSPKSFAQPSSSFAPGEGASNKKASHWLSQALSHAR